MRVPNFLLMHPRFFRRAELKCFFFSTDYRGKGLVRLGHACACVELCCAFQIEGGIPGIPLKSLKNKKLFY